MNVFYIDRSNMFRAEKAIREFEGFIEKTKEMFMRQGFSEEQAVDLTYSIIKDGIDGTDDETPNSLDE